MTLLLTPTAVLLVSLAGRRWGPIVGGRLAALPLTSGPLVLVVALVDGEGAVRTLSAGILAGIPTVVVFCLGYRVLAARHAWPVCLPVTVLATALAAGLIGFVTPPAWVSVGLVGVAVVITVLRRPSPHDYSTMRSPWELPLRMAITTGLVLGLSMVSRAMDPRLAGVFAAFPALACVLAAMAHRSGGAGAAIDLMRGLLVGLVPTTLLFLGLTVGL